MESLILSQNTCWKQKIGYNMSRTLRGEIWGLSFAVPHSEGAKAIEIKTRIIFPIIFHWLNFEIECVFTSFSICGYLFLQISKDYFLFVRRVRNFKGASKLISRNFCKKINFTKICYTIILFFRGQWRNFESWTKI